MSDSTSSVAVENPIGKVYAVIKAATRDKLIEPLSKAAENLSDARRHWANKVRDYSRNASENSDEWAESHLYLIAGMGAGVGLILSVFFALP